MIFVTVGTHEQQFNRLVEFMDKWAENHEEEVIIQTGYSSYEPKKAKWSRLYTYNEMQEYVQKARIVITHGGPSSFIAALQYGKIPVVVPRKKEYGEHVNNHQVTFCREVAQRKGNIIEIEDIDELENVINEYEVIVNGISVGMEDNNKMFCRNLEKLIESICK